jgi:16S rRNA processing protein RimM
MKMDDKLIKLGFCNKAHGIKGGFLFALDSGKDSILKNGFEITIKSESFDKKVKIKSITFGNKTICYLPDVIDRNQVEAMLPFEIFVHRDDFPKLEAGAIYLADLIGYAVVDLENNPVGKVCSFSSNGPQDIIKILTPKSPIELPFVDQFFPEINQETKTITIDAPEFV